MTELKEQAELLYKHLSETDAKRILGIANGEILFGPLSI